MDKSRKRKRRNPKNRTSRDRSNVFIVGVSGASGCGKSYFVKLLKTRLIKNKVPAKNIQVISCDDYYKTFFEKDGMPRKADSDTYEKTPEYLKYNWDTPDAVDLEMLENHLRELKRGENVMIPEFNFNSSIQTLKTRKVVDASKVKVIIVEGLFTFYLESLRQLFDLKLFISSDMEVCLVRRLLRDFEKRGSDYNRTIKQYLENVKPAYYAYIEPTKAFADFTINNSYDSKYTTSIDIVCEHIQSRM
jgi:uridine kinase